jgi:hypothetical protein
MNKQQTAVDWLDNEIQNICLIEYSLVKNRCLSIPIDKYMELKQKAKAMEKQQIETAFEKGFSDGSQDFKNDMDYIDNYADDFGKQYYNKTYE